MKKYLFIAFLFCFSAVLSAEVPPIPKGVSMPEADWAKYQAWVATLPADEQAWEGQLQKYLGGYYLPRYVQPRLNGKYTYDEPGDWGFVKDDPNLPRVLLIGDSISHMYTSSVRQLLRGKANIHRAPANCGSTDAGLQHISDWVAVPNPKWDYIVFNFGIHDRFKPIAKYAENLEKVVTLLETKGAKLVWVTTTPFSYDEKSPEQVKSLNDTANTIMQKHGIPVIDICTPSQAKLDNILRPDMVHFQPEGVRIHAETIASELSKLMKK